MFPDYDRDLSPTFMQVFQVKQRPKWGVLLPSVEHLTTMFRDSWNAAMGLVARNKDSVSMPSAVVALIRYPYE